MTTEELRELDAEIHKSVFGKNYIADVGELWDCGDSHEYGDESEAVPRYSTDITAAIQVAEKLSEINHTLVLEDWRSDRQRWCALFHLADGHDTGQFVADTAALAITLAALKAVGSVRWVKPAR